VRYHLEGRRDSVFASITEDPTLNSRMQVRRVFGRVCAGGASVLSPMVSDWLESVATVGGTRFFRR
jgi:hypothetical protein